MRKTASLFGLSLLLCTAAHADTMTLAEARAAADKEIDLVSNDYVFPEKRAEIAAAMKASEAKGKYDLTDPRALADALAADAIGASHDKHMWVRYDPAGYQAMISEKPGDKSKDAEQNAYFEKLVRDKNYGYEEMRILPGNVRYLDLTTFNWEEKDTPQAVADAARFLSGGDAVIIDVRHNGGGSPQAVRSIVSYFLPPDGRTLMNFHDVVTKESEVSHVIDKLDAPRMVGKPLYVLISGSTGSAAEEFAYHIEQFKIGTLVGETTAGAANNNSVFPIAPGFLASISTGRTVHPVSGTNWEGVGVPADVTVPAARALDRAYLLALQKLAQMPGADAKTFAWAIEGATAHDHGALKLDAATLASYTGTYGIRTVKLADGALVFQREGRPELPLTPMAADLFRIGDEGDGVRLHFRRAGGKVVGFDMLTEDGRVVAADKNGA